jgi:hypothetical protein
MAFFPPQSSCACMLSGAFGDIIPFNSCRRPWYVTTSVLIGWFLSFSLVYLMPVDVASTKHEDCIAGNHNNNISDFSPSILSNSSNSNGTHSCSKPFMYIPFRVRKILWEIIYWSVSRSFIIYKKFWSTQDIPSCYLQLACDSLDFDLHRHTSQRGLYIHCYKAT